MRLPRRLIFIALLPALLAGAATAHAQVWPARPIKTINPFPPGGPADVLGRILGDRLQQRLGQPIVIETRAGAGGMIGVDAALRAAPDGYTFAWVVDFTLTFNPSLYAKMPYDIERDLAPVGVFATSEVALVAHPAVAASGMRELVALAKTRPLAFPSGGVGSPGHIFGELFKSEFNLDNMTHVPYKGNAPASQSVLGGETQVFFGALPGTLPHVRAGKLKALAVFAEARLPYLAEVPTAREQGFPRFLVRNWYGLVAPAATPREIIVRLNREIAEITREAEFAGRLEKLGYTAFSTGPEEMRALIKSDGARWGALIRAGNIRSE
jgi:tripartite-type tricarboxylate transporter receptor subunit TctC